MRIADVLRTRWSDINDNRLQYRMGKNSKLISIKISQKALLILDKYKADKRSEIDFIFPELKKADLNEAKDVFNKIKILPKNITIR
ncbi:site-specific integrase [Winogradskyella sp. PC D3.3]